jgi:hypothetical protein
LSALTAYRSLGLAVLLVFGACASAPEDKRIAWPGPSLSADWVVYQRGDPGDISVTRLHVDRERGMRFDYPSTHRSLSAILRFDSSRAWLLDPGQRHYAPLVLDRGVTASELPGLGRSQLLAPRPCPGFAQRERLGVRHFGGRDLEIWECRQDRLSLAIHRYDPQLGLVTYEESADGWVNELRNIRLEGPDPALFTLPKDYRKLRRLPDPR